MRESSQSRIKIVSALPVPGLTHSIPFDSSFPQFYRVAARLVGTETTLDGVITTLFGPAVMAPEQHAYNPYVMALSSGYLKHALQERIVTPGAMILSLNGGNQWLSRTYLTSPSPGRLFLRYDLIDKERTVSNHPPVFLSTPLVDLRYQSVAQQLGPGKEESLGEDSN